MEFDIILHGKPNAGSHKTTKGIEDSFCQNLVENFFQSMNYIKEQEVLIVDVRNWKNKWYSIYTFWLGGYITDTAERSSFLAISIVVPNQYFCLVSAVYDMLKNAYLNSIIGTYISSKGEYIVQNFNNDSAFERLVNTINSNFVNLSENFDNKFKQDNNGAITNCCYNLLDCDSKAFVEDWRKHGRIFVSKTCDSKDMRLSNTDKYYKELQDSKNKLQSKLQEIEQLTARIKELEGMLNSGNSKIKKDLASLKEQVKVLKSEKKSLEQNVSNLSLQNERHCDIEKQITHILGSITIDSSDNPNKEETTPHRIGVKRIIPIINMVLLIFLLFATTFKSCGSQIKESSDEEVQTVNNLQQEIEKLNKIIKEKDYQIHILKSNSKLHTNNISDNIDIDCKLTVFQDNTPVDISAIDPSKKITIFVNTQKDYAFYTSNLKTRNVKNGVSFKLEKINPNQPIIIAYRSNDRHKCNQLNVVTIQ